MQDFDKVLACYNLSGKYDYQLEVIGRSVDDFSTFVRDHVRRLPPEKVLTMSPAGIICNPCLQLGPLVDPPWRHANVVGDPTFCLNFLLYFFFFCIDFLKYHHLSRQFLDLN